MKNRICLLAWTMIALALTASQSLAQSIYEPYTFTTLAGNAQGGSADGTGSDARFQFELDSGVAVDNTGNVYVADNNAISQSDTGGSGDNLCRTGGRSWQRGRYEE